MHEQFLKAVSEGRKIPIEEMRKIGDGRVFTGEQALGVKLVDQLGNLQDAIDLAAQTVGIKGEPKVIKVEKKKPGFLDLLSGDEKLENRLSAWFATARISKAYFLSDLST